MPETEGATQESATPLKVDVQVGEAGTTDVRFDLTGGTPADQRAAIDALNFEWISMSEEERARALELLDGTPAGGTGTDDTWWARFLGIPVDPADQPNGEEPRTDTPTTDGAVPPLHTGETAPQVVVDAPQALTPTATRTTTSPRARNRSSGPTPTPSPATPDQPLPGLPTPPEFELDSPQTASGGFDELPPDGDAQFAELPTDGDPDFAELPPEQPQPGQRSPAVTRRPAPRAEVGAVGVPPSASEPSPVPESSPAETPLAELPRPPKSATSFAKDLYLLAARARQRLAAATTEPLRAKRRAEYDAARKAYADYLQSETESAWFWDAVTPAVGFVDEQYELLKGSKADFQSAVDESAFEAGGAVQDVLGGGALGSGAAAVITEVIKATAGLLMVGPNLVTAAEDFAQLDDEFVGAAQEIVDGRIEGDGDKVLRGHARLVLAATALIGTMIGAAQATSTAFGGVRTRPGTLKRDGNYRKHIEYLPPDWQAHHLIQVSMTKGYRSLKYAADRLGFDINRESNIVGLPSDPEVSRVTGRALHNGGHLGPDHQGSAAGLLKSRLDALERRFNAPGGLDDWELIDELHAIEDELREGLTSGMLRLHEDDLAYVGAR